MAKVAVLGCLPAILGFASRGVRCLSAILVSLMMIGFANAAEVLEHINVDQEGYSIDRYDPVSYFTDGRPIRGNREFTAEYNGAKYAFSSKSNRDQFLRDPEKYLPQYGGYCAYGVVHGSKSDVDPEVWDVVDGKLYLMISGGTMSIWQKRKRLYIKMANNVWKSIIN